MATHPSPVRLPAIWRERAETLEKYAPGAADAILDCAEELEEALQRADEQVLNLQDAAAASGYSAAHLGRLIRQGKIPNAGRKHAPRIRRGDLPIKPGCLSHHTNELHVEAAGKQQIVRSIAERTEDSDG